MVEVDTTTIVVIVAVIVLAVLTYFELKYLRKSSHGRRIRTRKRDGELPDEAHNVLLTTKAIVATVERLEGPDPEAELDREEAAVPAEEVGLASEEEEVRH
ncbi:MAG: hypothetical protein AABX97_00560, partial [Candidatus Thermoplasmatota archaeon]